MSLNNKNNIAAQISSAVAYLHLRDVPILHRDIKSANVIVNTAGVVKLCDLGLSKFNALELTIKTTQGHDGIVKGSLMYLAPELLLKTSKQASFSSDIWSLACTFQELYSEKLVWDLAEFDFSLENICRSDIVPDLSIVPEYLKKIIKKMFPSKSYRKTWYFSYSGQSRHTFKKP